MAWIDTLSEEEKRRCGLLPEQIKARFTRQLEILKSCEQTLENRQVQGALKAALRRMESGKKI